MIGLNYDAEATYVFRYTGIVLDATAPTSPISFRRILPAFGIKYRAIELSEETDALYIPTSHGNYIYVNSVKPYRRRRFSIAHEFGHFYLHHPFHPGRPKEHIYEVQANKFAASILMPPDILLKLNRWMSTIKEIANWLRVSEIATAIRLQNLGLRTDECEIVISDYYLEQGDSDLVAPVLLY